ncbi:hypothetical protein SeMB42_g04370 [Synchytrium endobioticum]|uniref:Uncharacterized protein n=1 Tax=Synchytrium endobioticum TaxID=286115 RepID=A0A507CZM6_9FUNG|nr:hypothetical protein SeMB42_g04370 [Synchytrium endobioticum]
MPVRRFCAAASCGCCLEKFSFSTPNIRSDIFANTNSGNLVMDPQCTPRTPDYGNDPTTDLLAYWKTPMADVIDDALLRRLDEFYSSNDTMYWKQSLPDVDVDVELNKTARNNDAVERNCVTFAVDKVTQSDRRIEQNKATSETVDMALASNKASGAIKPRQSSTTDYRSSSNTYSNPSHQQLSQTTKNSAGGRRQYYINNRDYDYDNCLHRNDPPSAPEVPPPTNFTKHAAAWASVTSKSKKSDSGNISRVADHSNDRYKSVPLPDCSSRSRGGYTGSGGSYMGRDVSSFDGGRKAQWQQPPAEIDSSRKPVVPSDSSSKEGRSSSRNEFQNSADQDDSMVKGVQGKSTSKNGADPQKYQTNNHDATEASKVSKGGGNYAGSSSATAPSPPLPSTRAHTFGKPRNPSGGPRSHTLTGAAVTTKLTPEELHIKMAEMKRQNEAIRAQIRRTQEEEAAFRRAEAMQHATESEKRRMVGERLAAERIEADRKAEVALKAEASVMAERPEKEASKTQGQAKQVSMSSSTANSLDQSLVYSDWGDYPVEEEMNYSEAPSFPDSHDIATSSEAQKKVSTPCGKHELPHRRARRNGARTYSRGAQRDGSSLNNVNGDSTNIGQDKR